ncbi:MAG: murein biosynthesis integral membrane protein MurJ [Capsulimonadaceae bacterium]|nr:murein biosynthesis integral membrane protein MurJ [Capsulimonadaceae bacterium]
MAAPTLTTTDKQTTANYKQGSIGGAAFIMVMAVIASRLLGMVRDMVVAAQFGRTANTDAYNAAFSIPDMLMYLVAGGAISSTFIPIFTKYLHDGDEKGAWEVFSIVGSIIAIVTTAAIVLMEIFTPQLVAFMNLGYTADQIDKTIYLARIVLPAQFFFIVGSLLMGSLNARNRMLVPALGPSIYNIGIIIGALLAHPNDTGPFGGMRALMWGALGGAFVGNFLIQAIASAKLGMRYRFSLNWRHPGVSQVWAMLLPIMFGMALPNVDQIIMRSFASMLPHGGQTALTLANRCMLIPIGIFAQAMSIAVLPAMSRHTAAGAMKKFRQTTSKTLRTILFLTVPSSALMFILALPLVQVLYQRHNFHAVDAEITAAALRFYALGIFAWSCQAILVRGFYALHDTRTPVRTGRWMTGLLILLNLIVVHLAAGGVPIWDQPVTSWQTFVQNVVVAHFGVGAHPVLAIEGIALCTTLAATIYMLILITLLHRRLKDIEDRLLTIAIVRIVIATALLCVGAYVSQFAFNIAWPTPEKHVTLHGIAEIIFSGSIALAAYCGLAKYFKMAELDDLARMASSKLRPILVRLRIQKAAG